MLKKIIPLCLVILFMQACGSSSVKEGAPNVTSSPSGASVFANGVKLGVTPLKTDLFKSFPASWQGWKLSATGVLAIKKSGCEDFAIKVNDGILIKPIHAKLKCNAKVVTPVSAPIRKDVRPVKKPQKKMSKIEKRLNELTELHKKGVITDAEYKNTRKRILSEM